MKTWVEKLIIEYSDKTKELETYRQTLDPENPDHQFDRKAVEGMIASLNYALEWMRSGRRPWSRRGVESRDAYRRAALMDMDLFPALDLESEEIHLTDERKRQLVGVLLKLSTRERQCYLLHMAQGMSLADIAKELKIAKGVVQTHIKRARAKVQKGLTG